MAKAELNVQALYSALDSERKDRGITWKDVAAEVGVNASTLTRMAQGKRPDVDGLASLLEWLNMDVKQFIISDRSRAVDGRQSTVATVSAALRSDSSLSSSSAKALEEVFKASYEAFRQKPQK